MAGAMRRMDGATSRLHSGNSAEGFPAMRDWEQCYRDGETPWDKGSPAPPLLELIERHGVELWGGGPVLVPGCGLGHNVRALAANGIPALGLDISPTAVEMAREQAAEGACYEVGDFLDPAWRVGPEFFRDLGAHVLLRHRSRVTGKLRASHGGIAAARRRVCGGLLPHAAQPRRGRGRAAVRGIHP